MAVIFALCCLGCSAVNDFIFKLFADRPMSRGVFFSIIMPIAGLAFWGAVILSVSDLVRSKEWYQQECRSNKTLKET